MIRRSGCSLPLVFVLTIFFIDPVSAAQSFPGQPAAYVQNEILVKFRPAADESDKVVAHHNAGGKRAKVFKHVKGLERIKLPPGLSVKDAIEFYQQNPEVLYAEPNYIVKTTAKAAATVAATPSDPSFGSLWGLHNTGQSGGTADVDIDAPEAWNITTGSSNVVVVVIDTGIDYNHQDLAANMFRNTADCNNNGFDDDGNGHTDDCFGIDTIHDDTNPMDDHSHGTHVAGTIGAVGNNKIGVVGVNWTVRLMPCRFIDASGSGTNADAIACLEYVKEMKDSGINIVATSNSWGDNQFSQAMLDAINVQRQNGILFIAAAGNGNIFGVGQNNDITPFYPCNYSLPNIICVASTNRKDARSSFSNYGRRTVHIGAPGSDILSTTPGNTYTTSSGTSMATPHVTGVAALLKAQDPTRDWKAIKNLILTGGDTKSAMANTITGKRLNANGALTCTNSVVLTRLIPVPTTINASPGTPVDLAALHIKCANANGNVSVSVSPGNQTVILVDNGLGSDQEAGDGIYSGQWIPSAPGDYTLTFPGNDKVTVKVANPAISVTPSSLDFGNVAVGSSSDKNFTVQNSGGGVLTGNATTNPPYSIVAGGSYSLNGGQSQTVIVRFTPSSVGTFGGTVSFSGAEGTSKTVTGSGSGVSSITPNPMDLASAPSNFTITGGGFANLGYGLPVVNFYTSSTSTTVIAQARATSMTSDGTSLTVPYPTDA
ncbi:MAG TPA: S8 family serine peptidase, partial [Candidatus Acidoferrales bacterium]|nr:S8 family serine peptidase [Candidatus Acidoferrales bacterium]